LIGKKKILIVDDHSAVRNGLKLILQSRFENLYFGEAESARQCVSQLSQERWDMIILDINLPDKNGLELLNEIKEKGITVPVLIFSFHPEDQIAIRAIRLGAHGYVAKDATDSELILAVDMVLHGNKYVSKRIASLMITNIQNGQEKEPHELLSEREFHTFMAIALGKPISSLAEELSLSISTVNTYRARVLDKMNMKSNAEIIRYAIENKLI
jgi:two-component system, NarL family, invasion response regulator UvrY